MFSFKINLSNLYSFAMICYEVITRKEVFQDARSKQNLLLHLISCNGQKPNAKHVSTVEEELMHCNNDDLELFQTLKTIMEQCWSFAPQDRLSMKQGIYHQSEQDFHVELLRNLEMLQNSFQTIFGNTTSNSGIIFQHLLFILHWLKFIWNF